MVQQSMGKQVSVPSLPDPLLKGNHSCHCFNSSQRQCIIFVCVEAFLHTAHLGNHSILEHVDLLHLFPMVLEGILLHPFNNVPVFTEMCFKSLAVFCNMNHTTITVCIYYCKYMSFCVHKLLKLLEIELPGQSPIAISPLITFLNCPLLKQYQYIKPPSMYGSICLPTPLLHSILLWYLSFV